MATIGTAAKRAGCNIETVRYYERIGLLPVPPRRATARRDYGESELRRLSFIRRCRDLGFTLKEIRTLIALSGGAGENCKEVKSLAERQITLVRQKMADLARVEDWLGQMVERCGAPRQGHCPMIETLLAPAAALPQREHEATTRPL